MIVTVNSRASENSVDSDGIIDIIYYFNIICQYMETTYYPNYIFWCVNDSTDISQVKKLIPMIIGGAHKWQSKALTEILALQDFTHLNINMDTFKMESTRFIILINLLLNKLYVYSIQEYRIILIQYMAEISVMYSYLHYTPEVALIENEDIVNAQRYFIRIREQIIAYNITNKNIGELRSQITMLIKFCSNLAKENPSNEIKMMMNLLLMYEKLLNYEFRNIYLTSDSLEESSDRIYQLDRKNTLLESTKFMLSPNNYILYAWFSDTFKRYKYITL